MTQQQQIVTAAEEAEADDFDAMMTALDIFFHAHRCPHHSGAERMAAYAQAEQAYATFCGFDMFVGPDSGEPEPEPEPDDGPKAPNAPTSNKVH